MAFTPARQAQEDGVHVPFWLIADHGRVLVRTTPAGLRFPDLSDLNALTLEPSSGLTVGHTEQQTCLLVHGEASAPVPEGFEWMELRSLSTQLEEELFWLAGRANLLAEWDRAHRFCGACGTALELKAEEWAKLCPSCGQLYYPQISPAVIVSVVDGDRILLARHRHYRYPFFTVLAGFVEPGEDLESAVLREIHEEVGITVKNLRYFGSQPWPFPNSLMIAFTAEYVGGELLPDPSEIQEAAWFTRDAMPELPLSTSISRRLIRNFVEAH